MKKLLFAIPVLLLILVSGCAKDDIPTQISVTGNMIAGVELDFELVGEFNKNTEYRWDMDSDGTWDMNYPSSNMVSYTYAAAGDYTVTVEVMSPKGDEKKYTFGITIG